MFNFIKKAGVSVGGGEETADDKERRKREKKERKEKQKRDRGSMTAEEILNVDELRRSLKLKGRRKEKEKLPSGITADYSANFFAELDRDSNYSNFPITNLDSVTEGSNLNLSDENNHFPVAATRGTIGAWRDGLHQSDSSETSLNSLNNPNGLPKQPPSLPPLPPRPPKRGILKGHRPSSSNLGNIENQNSGTNSPDYTNGQDVLIRNTSRNQVISYQNVPVGRNGVSNEDVQNFTKKVIHSPVDTKSAYFKYGAPPPIMITSHGDENGRMENGNNFTVTSPTPSAESLTDTTTNSSFATPPFSMSPTGDSDGFHRWSSNFEGVNLPLPEISPAELPPPRVLTIQRQKAPRNDFGFSLRRAMIVERCWSDNVNGRGSSDDEKDGMGMKAVIFAEPGSVSQGHETGLLPGDRLLEVNGISVDDKSREEIIDMIKSSQDFVTVKVQPVAELSELWRRWAANGNHDDLFNHNSTNKPQESAPKPWQENGIVENEKDGEKLWVCHRGGFTAARKMHSTADEPASPMTNGPSPRTRVELLSTGETLDVDDDDLEKANPSQFDQVEDLAILRYINESSALHALRQRYGSHLVHTAAGNNLLLLINPVVPLNIYSDKVATMFKGCKTEDTPPHLYAWAQAAHRATLGTRRDQALVFMGRSRSGKSLALRRAALYLAAAASPGTNSSPWTPKIAAALTAFGAFTSAYGSRCVQVLSLYYDHTGVLASASLHGHMLDISKVPTTQRLEGTFDIFNWLIFGCEGQLRRNLLLEGHVTTGSGEEISAFARVTGAFKDLSVTDQEQLSIWRVLSAIWHLCSAGATKVTGGGGGTRYQFQEPAAAARAAQLLGCCSEELARALFSSSTGSTPTQPRTAFRTPSPTERSMDREISGQEALEGFISGLYTEVFNCVVALINRCLTTGARTVSSLLLVDPPGLSGGSGGSAAGGLAELAANYLHERLQLLAHERAVLAPRAACRQEGISLAPDSDSDEDWIAEVINPAPMVDLLDRAAQNTMVRTSQADLRDVDRKGLLWLLDEEAMHPGASDNSFLERAITVWSGGSQSSQNQCQLLKRAPQPLHFVLHHMQGTFPVIYNASGWLKASRENPVSRNAIGILQESSCEDISRLFVWSRGLCGAGPDAQASLRRASSIRRTLTTGAVVMNRRSFVGLAQAGAESVLSLLRRSRIRFICCALARRSSQHMSPSNTPLTNEQPIDVPLLRSQFRGFQLLEAARMHKQGFPDSLPFAEFARRFRLLASEQGSDNSIPQLVPLSLPTAEQRRLVEDMLRVIDLDPSSYRLGVSQVLLRAGALPRLENARAERLRACITGLQAACRGVLARRALARRRVQQVAVRCIQRNVRAFLAVRDWPWWRLLVRVAPLLAVHRTEDQLKAKTEELEALRLKVEKLETERSGLKHENDKLENKLSEMTAELAVEQAAGTLAAERLSAETAERLRIERDLQTVKLSNSTLQQTSERLETELMYARAETNGSVASETGEGGAGSDSEGSGDGSRYKRRLQVALRELEAARRQLRQQHEDDLEQLVTLKKQLEKKAADAYEEAEEQRQVAAQWKRKAQKAASDANDVRLLLDEQGAKAVLLERRQRKFDAECQQLREEARRERQTRERAQRDYETLLADKCSLEQTLADTRMELETKEEKLASVQREIEDLTFGGKTEEEIGALKRIKHDLENKCHDQEEELDELAGQVQLLESHKVRLEMSLEQQRKASRLEASQREEELEEVRAQTAKKVKALESQLEMEHNERTLVLRERHELERRLASLEESARADASEREQREQRMKRDLRRYKALARDAQVVLERREQDSGTKAQLRQLRDKLDDAEVTLRAAQKARQTAETELAEALSVAEEASRGRREAEMRATQAQREATSARSQLEEAEEEAADVLKKYRACVTALSEEQRAAREAVARATAAEDEARTARERVAELTARLASADNATTAGQALQNDKLELRTKELEASLELEQTARTRLEAQAARARESAAASTQALAAAQQRDMASADELRKVMRTVRELREELSTLNAKCDEAIRGRSEAEARLDEERSNAAAARADLRATKQRLTLLQQAITDEISPDNDTDSENDSCSSDESIETFLANHKLSPVQPNIGSTTSRSSEGRQSRSSVSSSKMSPAKESYA